MAVEREQFDVAIIGAGLYGIQAGRYYLQAHPDARLVIFEADGCIGGAWSKQRVYPNFWTQTPLRMAEFSDRPMKPPPKEDQYWDFFPGRYLSSYLEGYVDDHTYNGSTLRDRIKLNTTVQHIEKLSNGHWQIIHENGQKSDSKRVIDATGLTSQPYVPAILGAGTFQGLSLHHKAFGQSSFLSDSSKEHIVVLGGAKSAADVAYASAKAGKKVSWIVREHGSGPSAFFGVQPASPRYANSNEGFYNRFLANFLPNPFGSKSILYRLLQGTKIGRWYVNRLWNTFDTLLRGITNYEREEGKENGFANLAPDTPIFWQNDSSSVETQPDLLSVIASSVKVYRQDIDHISSDSIVLSSGKTQPDEIPISIRADVLVYCTGWSPKSGVIAPDEASKYGLPVAFQNAESGLETKWKTLEDRADPTILSKFPHLRDPPPYRKIDSQFTPFRLYKAMAPCIDCVDHSIVFLGRMVVGNNFRTAEAQALWAVAYMDGHITPPPSEMEEDIALTVAWNRRRYLNKGQLGSWYYYDVVAYADMLLEQLGLSSHRRKGWFANLMDPCVASDLKGLADEYKARYGPREGRK